MIYLSALASRPNRGGAQTGEPIASQIQIQGKINVKLLSLGMKLGACWLTAFHMVPLCWLIPDQVTGSILSMLAKTTSQSENFGSAGLPPGSHSVLLIND